MRKLGNRESSKSMGMMVGKVEQHESITTGDTLVPSGFQHDNYDNMIMIIIPGTV